MANYIRNIPIAKLQKKTSVIGRANEKVLQICEKFSLDKYNILIMDIKVFSKWRLLTTIYQEVGRELDINDSFFCYRLDFKSLAITILTIFYIKVFKNVHLKIKRNLQKDFDKRFPFYLANKNSLTTYQAAAVQLNSF